jgi:hypothetical protein
LSARTPISGPACVTRFEACSISSRGAADEPLSISTPSAKWRYQLIKTERTRDYSAFFRILLGRVRGLIANNQNSSTGVFRFGLTVCRVMLGLQGLSDDEL